MSTPAESEARAAAIAALEWFDSIQGDRENGRVLIEYHVLATLASRVSTPPSEDWEYECRIISAEPGWEWRSCDEDARFCPKGSERRRRLRAGPWEPVPAVPVPPTEPETLAPMSPVFEDSLTDDEWVERRLAAPTEPEEKR